MEFPMTFPVNFRRLFVCSAGLLVVLAFLSFDAAAQTDRKAIVAVFDINNQGTPLSSAVVGRLGDYLAGRLAMCGRYSIAPRDQLKERLAGQRTESYKECYDQSCQIELGKLMSADKSLATAFLKIGSVCAVTSLLYDVRTETTEQAAAQEGGCDEDSIRMSLQAVISQLCQGGKTGLNTNSGPAPQEVILPPPPAASSRVGAPVTVQDLPPVRKEVGYLSVQGEPKGARLDIEGPSGFGQGGMLSTSLPMRPIEVPPGNYRITASLKEYDPEKSSIRVSADETKLVTVKLVKTFGHLILSGEPEGAKTSLKCQKNFEREFGLPAQPFEILAPRGDCKILVSRDGYESYEKAFRLEAGQEIPIVVKLAKRQEKASVVAGDESIGAGLDRETIRRYIQTKMNQIRWCYQQELQKNPELAGKVVMQWIILPSGYTTAVKVSESTIRNVGVETCVSERIAKWRFPAPPGGQTIPVSYPFIFNAVR